VSWSRCLAFNGQLFLFFARRTDDLLRDFAESGLNGTASGVSGLANRRGSLDCWMNAIVQSLANVTSGDTEGEAEILKATALQEEINKASFNQAFQRGTRGRLCCRR
jgi:hypothetical protein